MFLFELSSYVNELLMSLLLFINHDNINCRLFQIKIQINYGTFNE